MSSRSSEIERQLLEGLISMLLREAMEALENTDRALCNQKLNEIQMIRNQIQMFNLDLQYLNNTQDLGYQIQRIRLIIEGYEIQFKLAPTDTLGSLINKARDELMSLRTPQQPQGLSISVPVPSSFLQTERSPSNSSKKSSVGETTESVSKSQQAQGSADISMQQELSALSLESHDPQVEQLISSLKKNPDRCTMSAMIIRKHTLITFQRRKSTEDAISSYIQSEEDLLQTDRRDKRAHGLGVMSALSGFGKTRLLLELPNLFSETKPHWKFIYMTYNSGFEEVSEELEINSDVAFAWRLLYFYFSPNCTLSEFLTKVCPYISELDLPLALKYISHDIKRSSELQNGRVVIIITIDEFQLLCACGRLRDVVSSIVRVMQTCFNEYICVPIFSGLYFEPFNPAAQLSSVLSRRIFLTPLGYNEAVEILVSLSGNEQLLQNNLIQQYIWKLSSLPACLVQLYESSRSNENWASGYEDIRKKRYDHFAAKHVIHENLIRLVALSITRLSPAFYYCPIQFLESSGLCWFNKDESIGAPYALLELLVSTWNVNLTRTTPPADFLTALKETAAYFVATCSQINPGANWMNLELLCWSYTALRMNCFGYLRETPTAIVPLSVLLRGAYIPGKFTTEGVDNEQDQVVPLLHTFGVLITPTHLTIQNILLSPTCWDTERSFYAKTCDDQDIVDAFGFFPNCTDSNSDRFDFFLFQQVKYHPNGASVYMKARDWCRKFVSEYIQLSGRQAGFIFGVINPLKAISTQLKTSLKELIDPDNREFYFAIGRDESVQHFGIFHDHPIFLPRVYINNPAEDQIIENAKRSEDEELNPTSYPILQMKLTPYHNPM